MRRDCRCPRAAHQHGTVGAYVYDECRCFPCRITYSHRQAAYAKGESWTDGRFPPAIGIRRRIEALHAIGWSSNVLAQKLGVSRQAVRSLRCHLGDNALQSTLERVVAVYDELWDQPATNAHADRVKRWADEQGFKPPMWWDDDTIDEPAADLATADRTGVDPVAVERAMAGHPPATLTKAERELAVQRLTELGLSARDISQRVKVTNRQIQRDRSAAA